MTSENTRRHVYDVSYFNILFKNCKFMVGNGKLHEKSTKGTLLVKRWVRPMSSSWRTCVYQRVWPVLFQCACRFRYNGLRVFVLVHSLGRIRKRLCDFDFLLVSPATVSVCVACADHDTVLTSHKMVGTLGGSLAAKTSPPSLGSCNDWNTFIRVFYKNTHINKEM